jgi:hypothetical protein
MTELPDDLATMPRAARVTHALALARTAAEWVRAAEEQLALELEPGAAPTHMRDTAARILAWLAGADDDRDALNEDLEGHQMVLVPDRDAGDPDPYELLEPDDVLALAGISALRCAKDQRIGPPIPRGGADEPVRRRAPHDESRAQPGRVVRAGTARSGRPGSCTSHSRTRRQGSRCPPRRCPRRSGPKRGGRRSRTH